MRGRLVLSLLGVLLALFGSTFLLPLFAGLLLGEPREQVAWLYGLPLLLSVGGGLLLYFQFRSDEELRDREAFALVSVAWLLFAVFGAIPYVMAGDMASSDGEPLMVYDLTLAEAYFESISGLTTTGATVFNSSVANGTTDDGYFAAPKSLLLWRSQSQWLGGMGIIVLATVVLSRLLGGGIQVLRAEMPGTGGPVNFLHGLHLDRTHFSTRHSPLHTWSIPPPQHGWRDARRCTGRGARRLR